MRGSIDDLQAQQLMSAFINTRADARFLVSVFNADKEFIDMFRDALPYWAEQFNELRVDTTIASVATAQYILKLCSPQVLCITDERASMEETTAATTQLQQLFSYITSSSYSGAMEVKVRFPVVCDDWLEELSLAKLVNYINCCYYYTIYLIPPYNKEHRVYIYISLPIIKSIVFIYILAETREIFTVKLSIAREIINTNHWHYNFSELHFQYIALYHFC